ncbi:MAG TPA: aminodeoxychorismate synthase component I [Saprospiraceae bacterium]|nr:aminodeoxychorismate synthase component I [Saprospiraceae bacterium]
MTQHPAISENRAIELMNQLGHDKRPFLFIIDFDKQKPLVIPLDELDPELIQYRIQQETNTNLNVNQDCILEFIKNPVAFETYNKAFLAVQKEIQYGNSFLLNLAFQTPIDINLSLYAIYANARAPYKLWLKDQVVCFSPETFVTIEDGKIYSYPMKGTIDAALPDAEELIIKDKKEEAEHYTIVDLIRNDLGMVANNIQVEKFRYIDHIKTNFGEILQVSSKISGDLPKGYESKMGDIIFRLLPAGSITGAPKKRTVEIIKEVEDFERGYYTGIFGTFDGKNLKSGVMIRFIEQKDEKLYFKSGGGITFMSDARSEYEEIINKVYVPIT